MSNTVQEFISRDGIEMIKMPKKDFIDMQSSLEDLIDSQRANVILSKHKRAESIPANYFFRVLEGENPVKVYRQWRGLTAKQLAEKIGVSQSYITNIENGKRDGSINVMNKIAQALNLPIQRLIVALET